MAELNVRQEAFCLHYAKTGNASESYKKAGYKANTETAIYANANRLLKNDKVQERLRELAAEIASDKIASIKEIQEYLTAVMRRELSEHVVVTLTEKKSTYVPDAEGKMRKQTIEKEVPQVVEIPAKLSVPAPMSTSITVPTARMARHTWSSTPAGPSPPPWSCPRRLKFMPSPATAPCAAAPCC